MNNGSLKKVLLFIFCSFLLAVSLIVGLTYFNKNSSTVDITMKRFEKLMQDGDIKDITLVINKRIVEVTLTENALRKHILSSELKERSTFSEGEGPHYEFTIFSPESFKDDFEAIQYSLDDDNPNKQLAVRVTERQELGSWLTSWGLFFLTAFSLPITYFLFVFIGLAKVMSGRFPQPYDKLTWSVIIIFVPILGFILFMMIGRKQLIQ